MAALSSQFASALSNIEPSDVDIGNAPKVHTGVRDVLSADPTLKSWGIDSVLIGSYKRHVAIRRVKDVDVFCKLGDVAQNVEPAAILKQFYKVLDDEFGVGGDGKRRTTMQARSVKVSFPEFDGLYVDAVPARPANNVWEIPSRSTSTNEPGLDGGWQRTDPENFTAVSSTMNTLHDDKYVPIVKLMRQWRRASGTSRPGGLLIEVVTYEAFRRGDVTGTNVAERFGAALSSAASIVDQYVTYGVDIPNPALPGEPIAVRATDKQWESLRDKLSEASASAADAYEAERCAAAAMYQKLLGGNDDHAFVFELPDDCNPDGSRRASMASFLPGDSHVPAGDRRFG